MFSNIRKLVALALGATFSIGAPSLAHALPVDETNVLVIIDVTGSMMTDSGAVTPGGDVQTRLEVGRLSAMEVSPLHYVAPLVPCGGRRQCMR